MKYDDSFLNILRRRRLNSIDFAHTISIAAFEMVEINIQLSIFVSLHVCNKVRLDHVFLNSFGTWETSCEFMYLYLENT